MCVLQPHLKCKYLHMLRIHILRNFAVNSAQLYSRLHTYIRKIHFVRSFNKLTGIIIVVFCGCGIAIIVELRSNCIEGNI